jgi:hypothetical protein
MKRFVPFAVAVSLVCAFALLPRPSAAQIFPSAEITPDPLDFGGVRVGTSSAPQTLTVTKTNGAWLPLFIFSVRLGNARDFGVVADGCTNATLRDIGDFCTVDLDFTPVDMGHYSTSFSIVALGQQIVTTSVVEGLGVEPNVVLSTSSIDFGDQTVGKTSSARLVMLTNSGNEALAISDIEASADFAVASDCPASLPAEGSCTLGVTFTPPAAGPAAGTVTITDDASDSPQAISLAGVGIAPGTPDISLSTDSLAFGNQLIGTTSASKAVTLTNTGTVDLTFNSIAASADFAQTNDCGATLAPDASCTVGATFTPPSAGAFTGTLTIDDDASDSPQLVNLSGTGVANEGPYADLSPATLAFGEVEVGGTSAPQAVTLTNTGDENLVIEDIQFGGDNPEDFDATDNCQSNTLVPGESCSGAVTFTPTDAGDFAATITIADNSQSSPHVIVLTGSGVGAGGGGCALAAVPQPMASALAVIPAAASLALIFIRRRRR